MANKIFSDCICGVLKEKLVVLVTHQLQFLNMCPRIMLLKEGSVVCQGSYEEIIQTGFNIKDILDSYNKALTAQEGQKNKFKDEKKKTNDASPSPTKLSESEPAKKQS